MLIFWVYAAFSFGPSPPFPNAPGPCVMVSPSGPFSFLLSLASACPTHEKSHRLLRAGRIRPRQGFPFAHNHFHRWKRIGSSTAGNHPAPGGEGDGGELYETHLQRSCFLGAEKLVFWEVLGAAVAHSSGQAVGFQFFRLGAAPRRLSHSLPAHLLPPASRLVSPRWSEPQTTKYS